MCVWIMNHASVHAKDNNTSHKLLTHRSIWRTHYEIKSWSYKPVVFTTQGVTWIDEQVQSIYTNYCCTMPLNIRKPETCHFFLMFQSCTGFSSIPCWNIGGRWGFQVLDSTVIWILSSEGPTIHWGRGHPYRIVQLCSHIFLDYLLPSAVTLSRDS